MNHRPTEPLLAAAYGFVALAGLTMAVAWLADDEPLIRFLGGMIPMQFNAAVGFALIAVAGAAHFSGRAPDWLIISVGALAALLGLTVIVEYTAGVSLGVDTLFVRPDIPMDFQFPGRMALPTAIGFTAAGVGLIAAGASRRGLGVLACMAVISASFSVGSLLGHVVGRGYLLALPEAWSQMAVLTAMAFLVWGLATMVAAWRRETRRVGPFPVWLPAFGATGTVALAAALLVVLGGDGRIIPALGVVAYAVTAALAFLAGVRHLQAFAANEELAAAMAAKAEQAALLDLANDGIFVRDLQSRVRYWNEGARRLYGWSSEEAIGKVAGELLHSVYPEPLAEIVREVLDTGYWEGELLHTRRDGQQLVIFSRWTLRRDTSGNPEAILEFNTNITRRVTAERELEKRARQLEEANRQLLDANRKLLEVDRFKDEFLAVISHELKTPLNFITGFASILEDQLAGPVNEKQAEYLEKIQSGAARMLKLVDDLLDVARIRAGKLHLALQPVTIGDWLAELVEAFRPQAERKGIRLTAEIQGTAVICADKDRILQVIRNLLSNAVKFTPEGGSVRVRTFPDRDSVVVEIQDTGIGISASELEAIFGGFHQADMSNTRQAGGLGLGLTISKALVQAHRGSMGVRSQEGEGSTFWLRLPLASGDGCPERIVTVPWLMNRD